MSNINFSGGDRNSSSNNNSSCIISSSVCGSLDHRPTDYQELIVVASHEHNDVPTHRQLNCLFGRAPKKNAKLRVAARREGNTLVTVGFSSQMASNAENVSMS